MSTHAVFRGINERLYWLDISLETTDVEIAIVCECSQRDCIERIVVQTKRYEELRDEQGTAIVVVGHPAPGDRVGDAAGAFEVVQLQPG